MSDKYYNIVAEGLEQTFKALQIAVLLAKGKEITVGPLKDDYIRKFGVWVKGDGEVIDDYIKQLKEKLKKAKLRFDILEWVGARERG